ncbi:VanW family protein [Corynebacterium ulceribovis]|uniref:VanW family protein n=1 Tax=Corynebacterium ulceribovis TaxID=487732 RepID=UPI00037B353F|nr:VanW family protein [Corynebacterium ulceribovis]
MNYAEPRRSGGRAIALTLLAIVLLAGLAYAVDLFFSKNTVPRGVTVAGIEIGGLNEQEAKNRLRGRLEDKLNEPVTLTAGEKTTEVTPQAAGLTLDWDKTIAAAGEQPLNPLVRIGSFFTTREVGVVSDIDSAKLNTEVTRIQQDLTIPPVNAAVAYDKKGQPKVTDAADGQTVNHDTVLEMLSEQWLQDDARLDLPVEVLEPEVKQDAAEDIMSGVVKKHQQHPLQFVGRKDVTATIPAQDMDAVLKFEADGNKLTPKADVKKLQAVLAPQLKDTEKKKQNAQISLAGGAKTVTPSQDGELIEWKKSLKDVEELLTEGAGSDKAARVEMQYKDDKATFTTKDAEAATFDDTVGEFTTGGFSGPSGENIRRTAALVDGAVVAPGDTFSLNGHTGPRGTAQGFVESGIILNGRADKAVGGGISQFATTLYNAAYFAGMEDVAHTPHSYYISRYPAGREATVFEGAIDLQFKNTSKYPVYIQATADSSQVTVRLKGVKTVDVQSIPGPRTNYTDPQRMEVTDENCSPSGGGRGFTVTDTRVVKDLNGAELSRETQTTVYDPNPIVVCK